MGNRKLYRQIAKQNGVTLKEVKHDMQAALNYAYKNTPNDGVTVAYQSNVTKKNEVPTVDEFINHAVKEVKTKEKKM